MTPGSTQTNSRWAGPLPVSPSQAAGGDAACTGWPVFPQKLLSSDPRRVFGGFLELKDPWP